MIFLFVVCNDTMPLYDNISINFIAHAHFEAGYQRSGRHVRPIAGLKIYYTGRE